METIKNEWQLIKNTSLQKWTLFFLITILFVLIPTLGIDAYYKYVDTTEYYQIQTPVVIKENVIEPCSIITLEFNVNSLIRTEGISNRALMVVDTFSDIGTRVPGGTTRVEIPITKTNGWVTKPVQIEVPCGLATGNYYFNAVVSFEVRGIKKSIDWTSIIFPITQNLILNKE
jgi:hypothetical protein